MGVSRLVSSEHSLPMIENWSSALVVNKKKWEYVNGAVRFFDYFSCLMHIPCCVVFKICALLSFSSRDFWFTALPLLLSEYLSTLNSSTLQFRPPTGERASSRLYPSRVFDIQMITLSYPHTFHILPPYDRNSLC